jgi:hypothetical protein
VGFVVTPTEPVNGSESDQDDNDNIPLAQLCHDSSVFVAEYTSVDDDVLTSALTIEYDITESVMTKNVCVETCDGEPEDDQALLLKSHPHWMN